MADDKTPESMGGQQFEEKNPTGYEPITRNCWAIDVLIEEVKTLFECSGITHTPSRFGANLVAEFTPATLQVEDMASVMPSLADDERVESVFVTNGGETITVTIVDNPILMDTRGGFGLGSAALGLDRQITPDDMTALAADLAAGGEGFTASPDMDGSF